jgi:5-(carboxyamino)imidazole ribonucleotide synthase
MIEPESTIGMLGGGQLGRMSILAGRHLGYKFKVFEPIANSPAGMVADQEFNANYSDKETLTSFAKGLSAITLEFENVSAEAVQTLSEVCPVHPNAEILYTCQNRAREKEFLTRQNIPCAPFAVAKNVKKLQESITRIGAPCVIKTADSGYDGKGQFKISQGQEWDAEKIWQELGNPDAVVIEKWISHQGEFSAIVARNESGEIKVFPIAENIHINHILHISIVPARLTPKTLKDGEEIAKNVAETLGLVGLLAIEFFLDPNGKLLVNEMAPRPHNSGHYTMNACATSQFEQHIRAVAGLPLGSTKLLSPCVMVNILGDAWEKGTPDWAKLLRDPDVKLHLYDKGAPRKGRKMGHFTVLAENIDTARKKAENLFQELMN